MIIQNATKADLEKILSLLKKTVNNMIQDNIYQWDENYPNQQIVLIDIINNHLYKIHEKNNLLGIISLNENQAPEYKNIKWHDTKGKVLTLHRLAINPEFQRHGIGKKLMQFAEDFALKNNYTSIRLDTFSENPKALNLYTSLGYKKVGQVYFEGKVSPFICFEKIIKNN